MHGMHTAISKVENSAQVLSCELKFAHVQCYKMLAGDKHSWDIVFLSETKKKSLWLWHQMEPLPNVGARDLRSRLLKLLGNFI